MATKKSNEGGEVFPDERTTGYRRPDVDDLLVQRDSERSPVLSVVMPTLDEEDGIAECIRKTKRAVESLNVTTEIIISDSSTDRTPTIARENGAIVVEPDEPGYGYAYRYAFERARGDYIAMGDADCTYDFSTIPKLMERILDGADIVMGSRLDGEIRPGAMPRLHEHVGNPALTKFLNAFYDAGVSDAHSGFRIFTREALDRLELETDGMEFASEMIMEAGARGLRIDEVPILYHERKGDATLESFRDGWRHVKFMLLNAPGYLFSIPGMLCSGLGAAVVLVALMNARIGSVFVGINSLIAGSLLFIVGYQIMSFGVFTTVAGDPIQMPRDPITTWIVDHVNLEQGVIFGIVVSAIGFGFAGLLIYEWVASGFTRLPTLRKDILAFTTIVIGMQTVFSSFFMDAI